MKKLLNHEAIYRALTAQGMNQRQLADAVDASAQAVTNWLSGRDFPRPASLLKLATTLSLSFDQLVVSHDPGRPVVAFRKKANTKTTVEHLAKAESIGMLLKPLVKHLPEIQVLRSQIASPSTDYARLQIMASQTRERLGLGQTAELEYNHLISEFKNCGAVLVPVLWGSKGNHENALHIGLPQEDVTFIFLNLDTHMEDFKFWMAHELAHVFTPQLCGHNDGEDFADAFAGALLYPKACAARAYQEAISSKKDKILDVLLAEAQKHMISLNSVFKEIQQYAKANGKEALPVEEKTIHATRNSLRGKLVSEALFEDSIPPSPARYIAACENSFQSSFFRALKHMVVEDGIGASYIQQVLNISLQDAFALHETLRH